MSSVIQKWTCMLLAAKRKNSVSYDMTGAFFRLRSVHMQLT